MTHRFVWRALVAAGVLAAAPSVAAAQGGVTVTGRVTNVEGVGLPGAQVFLSGQNIGTQSREDGSYQFVVANATGAAATLNARLIGFKPATATITLSAGTVRHDFTLEVNPLKLNDVVVTGAGTTTTREKLGNVINSVSDSLIKRAAEPQNVVSALTAKAPNVEVRTQSGEPGASASIKIRGATSVTGTNQPLFVVDGQPIDNSTVSTGGGDQSTVTQNRAADINPNDIQSVDILKGAAAAAIYGARAANGVVLITTKRGRAGATRYTVGSQARWDKVDHTVDLQREWGQGLDSTTSSCSTANCRLTSYSFGARIPSGTPTYDHSHDIFDTGLSLDNNVSVSGGNDRTTFYLSAGANNQDGIIVGPNNKYDRTSVRLKGTHQLASTLNVGGNFSYVDSRGKFVQKGSNTSGLLLGAFRTTPTFNNSQYLDPTYGLHRSYRFPNPTPSTITATRGYDNPFFTAQNPGNKSELGRSISNVNLDYDPLAWLSVRYTLGADYYNDQRSEALPLSSSSHATGQVTRLSINNLEIDHNLIATLKHSFGSAFDGTLTLGQNLNSRRYRQLFAQGLDLNAPSPLALQNTLKYSPDQEFRSLRHIEAYFAQAEASLFDQLYLTAGLRNDGFSTFGSSNRRANFPKASAAWEFTKFLGVQDQRGLLSYGKARVAYGETGREPPVYGTLTAFSSTVQLGSGFGDLNNPSQSGLGGLVSGTSLGNPNLKPERNRETEYGLDFGFLDQRADLGVTAYNKQSSDVILFVPVNTSQTGRSTQLANAAAISNKGLEVTLNLRPITNRTVAWDVGMQYGRNKGLVKSLAGAQFIPYNNEGFTGALGSSTVGFAPGVIRGNDFARCGLGESIDIDGDGTVDNIDALCGAGAKKNALFIGADGLPVVNPNEGVIADPNPKYTMGFSSSIKLFGKLTLSGLVDARKGGQVWDGTRGILYNFGTHKDTDVRSRTGTFGKDWQTDVYPNVAGPGAGKVAFADYQAWQDWFTFEGGGFGDVGAQFVEDGSFVKLRELAVAYTFDQPWVSRYIGFSNFDLRLAGRNLHTWTKYKGLDPEANLGGAEFLTQGLDYFSSPQTRSFVLSVSLNR